MHQNDYNNGDQYTNNAVTNDVNKLDSIKNYYCESIDLETCTDSSCASWKTYFTIDKFHEVNGHYYVLPCECTDKGLELFYVEDVEEYFKSAEN